MHVSGKLLKPFCIALLSLEMLLLSARADLTDGLVVHYTFSGNANNAAGPDYNGAVVGAQLAADKFGKAASAYAFNGAGDYITAPELPELEEVTLSAWIRPEADKSASVFHESAMLTPGLGTAVRVLAGGAVAATYSKLVGPIPDPLVSPPVITTGFWQHVVLTLKTNGSALYVNGAVVATNLLTGDIKGYHSPFYLGAANFGAGPDQFFQGYMDDVRIYGRGLSGAEVTTLFILEQSGNCSPRPATAVAQVVNGFVVGATINDPGCGYLEPPHVIIVGGNGSGALASARIMSGRLDAIYITNAGYGYTATPQIVIDPPPMPPRVTLNPSNQVVLAGSVATLEARAEGSLPLSYQWFKQAQLVPGAFAPVLSLTNCQVSDSGVFSLVITNVYGAATSAPAMLTVTSNSFEVGLVAYYPFNGNANDESGNSNHGSVQGPVLATDRFARPQSAYQFDGVNDMIRIPQMIAPVGRQDFTISSWLKVPSNVPVPEHLFLTTADGYEQWQIFLSDNGSMEFYTGRSRVGGGMADWLDSQWHQLTITRKAGGEAGDLITWYKDGQLLFTATTTAGNNAASGLTIGRRLTGDSPLLGLLDDMRLYSRALSSGEVQNLYDIERLDQDQDGLPDYEELNIYHTDPTKADSDGDGLNDYREVRELLTDPLKQDTDGDGYNDYAEVYSGKNPNDSNSRPAAAIAVFSAIELEFIPQNGKTYEVQSSPDLINWTRFDGPIIGDGNIWKKLYSIRAQGTRTFYRVELTTP